jgi:hypothetical protein
MVGERLVMTGRVEKNGRADPFSILIISLMKI